MLMRVHRARCAHPELLGGGVSHALSFGWLCPRETVTWKM